MALTEKGKLALHYIQQFFPSKKFSAQELSDACGEKIYAATLNGIVGNGYLYKLGGSPVQYKAVDELNDLLQEAIKNEQSGCNNINLTKAKNAKNDEFYTRYEDVETEIMKYRKQFKGKIVYLPCDDPIEKKSAFWTFFVNNFDAFGLKKLIATHYNENGQSYKMWIDADRNNDGYIDESDAIIQENLIGNGDFRSPECIDILNECDIVCTNPPFSLFREFFDVIMQANKLFLIICPQNAFKYKDVFPFVKEGKVWAGYSFNKTFDFIMSDDYVLTNTGYIDNQGRKHGKVASICWMTNMIVNKRTEEIVLTKKYNSTDYPQFDNYDAINVGRVENIPCDYDGIMGVPISFLGKHNPDQFEIIGEANHGSDNQYDLFKPVVAGKELFPRILIRRKK